MTIKFEVLNRFTGAVQFTAEIDCKADALPSVKLGLAVRWAVLSGADLGTQWIVQGPARSDGYVFFLQNLKGEGVRVKAGCRNFTLKEARKHWKETRADTQLGTETFAILDCLEAMAKARGLDLNAKPESE